VIAATLLLIGWIPEVYDDNDSQKRFRCIAIGASFVWVVLIRHIRDRCWLRAPVRNATGQIEAPGDSIPIHLDHMAERISLLIIIVLGEGVLGIVLPTAQQNAEFLISAGFACVIICCLQFLYFEIDNLRFVVTSMRRTQKEGLLGLHPAWWNTNLHMCIMISDLIVGVGIKCSLSYNQKLKTKYRLLLVGSVAASLLFSLGIHLSHGLPKRFRVPLSMRILFRFVVAGAIVGCGWVPYKEVPAYAFLIVISTLLVCACVFELYASEIMSVRCSRAPKEREAAECKGDSVRDAVTASAIGKLEEEAL